MAQIRCFKHGITKLSPWLTRKAKPTDRKDFKKKGYVDYLKCLKCVKEDKIESELKQIQNINN